MRTIGGLGKAIELVLSTGISTGNGPSLIHLGPGNKLESTVGADQGAAKPKVGNNWKIVTSLVTTFSRRMTLVIGLS